MSTEMSPVLWAGWRTGMAQARLAIGICLTRTLGEPLSRLTGLAFLGFISQRAAQGWRPIGSNCRRTISRWCIPSSRVSTKYVWLA